MEKLVLTFDEFDLLEELLKEIQMEHVYLPTDEEELEEIQRNPSEYGVYLVWILQNINAHNMQLSEDEKMIIGKLQRIVNQIFVLEEEE